MLRLRAREPVVCCDERPVVLRGDAHPARVAYESTREGTSDGLLAFTPGEAWRHVIVSPHRAVVIRVVRDHLSTHTAAALYQTFLSEEARRLAQKREFHYTPKHASWLNMTELELRAVSGRRDEGHSSSPTSLATRPGRNQHDCDGAGCQ